MYRIIVSLASLLLAACAAGPSSHEAMDKLNAKFDGKNVNEFFHSYGKAASSKPAKTGETVYRWVSIEPPTSGRLYPNYTRQGGRAVFVPGPDMINEPRYCELNIQTDKHNVIRTLSIIHDSTGNWSNSLCAEIFAP